MVSRRVGCGGGAGHPPRKKSLFVPHNNKLECILPQFLTNRKHGNLGARILQFDGEIEKLTQTVQKLSKNSLSDRRGGGDRTIAVP